MKYLILLVFFISSCCPKITTTVATSSDTTSSSSSDTLTELTFDTTKVAPIFIHDTVNMSSFCDSLKHGLSPVLELRVSKGSIKIKSDSTGHSEIECLTDSLIQVTITQKETITNLNEQIIRSAINKQIVIEEPIYKNPFFWIVVGVILLLSFFAFRKR